MSRSPSYLRRGLLGIAFAGSLGFGATQAFGSASMGTSGPTCIGPEDDAGCWWNCAFQGEGGGRCNDFGHCECGV